MSERLAMDPFETELARRVRVYGDVATNRRIDALAVARTAMSSTRAGGWSVGRLGDSLLGRRSVGLRWALACLVILLIGVVGAGLLGRQSIAPTPGPSASGVGSLPDALLHSWARPSAVVPGLDQWGTGFLRLASDVMEFGPEPGPAASSSAIKVAGSDTLLVTATTATQGCATGDVGAYRWLLEGKDTVLTLTAINGDACPARETALAGEWVRSDFPPPPGDFVWPPAPGTYPTSNFDPFGDPAAPMRLSYTVPAGWTVEQDDRVTLTFRHAGDPFGSPSQTDSFVVLSTQPRMAADFPAGGTCGPFSEAPGVGTTVDDLVAALRARPGVVATPPTAVTIGGFAGRLLDLSLAPSWTRVCLAPEGPVVGIPILLQAGGTGPTFGIGRDNPLRLILLDLTRGRTMSIAFYVVGPSQASAFDARAAEAMPIISSFEFRPPGP